MALKAMPGEPLEFLSAMFTKRRRSVFILSLCRLFLILSALKQINHQLYFPYAQLQLPGDIRHRIFMSDEIFRNAAGAIHL